MKLYAQNKGFNATLNTYRAKQVINFGRGETCLEVGCGEGQITKLLVKTFKRVVAVDCELEHCTNINHYENLITKCGYFEEMILEEKFDFIVCTNILEHIRNLKLFFKKIREVCHKNTIIFFSVPNAKSYNRQLGVELDILNHCQNLGEQDRQVGHKRMFTPLELEVELLINKFKIIEMGTMIYKPFPNSMMNKLPKSVINKCLNYKMKNCGAEIYTVCGLQ